MKRVLKISVVLLVVCALLFFSAKQYVAAKWVGPNPGLAIAEDHWLSGTEVPVTLVSTPAPAWLQLLTSGVQVTSPGKICHYFRGGQFGWVGEIRMLDKGVWVMVPTTTGFYPNPEGRFMACADVQKAGLYALFGYYLKPAGLNMVDNPVAEDEENVDIYGCTDSDANNYDPSATIDDESCTYDPGGEEDVWGCTDSDANNYNPSATIDDESCTYDPGGEEDVWGCTFPGAINYNPLATIDDDSCQLQ